jgi:hypothetical protein
LNFALRAKFKHNLPDSIEMARKMRYLSEMVKRFRPGDFPLMLTFCFFCRWILLRS